MIFTLAVRSLLAHPIRSAVLAAGFGAGVAVMAILLGVAEIVLEQSRSPELVGGGDVLVTGVTGSVSTARALFGGALRSSTLGPRVAAALPWRRTTLYLLTPQGARMVRARGGIPSRERAFRDQYRDQRACRQHGAGSHDRRQQRAASRREVRDFGRSPQRCGTHRHRYAPRDATAREPAATNRSARRGRLALRLCRAGDVGYHRGHAHRGRRTDRLCRRRCLPRSQLGLLARRLVAAGT